MDTPAERKAAKKCRLHEKRATAHIPTAADDTTTSTLSNSPILDSPAATSPDMDNFVHSAMSSTSENITSATSQPLWNNLSNVCQEAENYFHKQQLCTALIATYSIVEPTTTANTTAPEYTETVTPLHSPRVTTVTQSNKSTQSCCAWSNTGPNPDRARSPRALGAR